MVDTNYHCGKPHLSDQTTILALECSQSVLSLALNVRGMPYSYHETLAPGEQSNQLLPQLKTLMTDAQVSFADLTAIVTGIGPGRFIGIRLAVSVVQGLASAYGTPVLGLSSLELLAYEAWLQNQTTDPIVVVNDARKRQYFVAIYQFSQDERQTIMPPTLCDDMNEVKAMIGECATVITGDCTEFAAIAIPHASAVTSDGAPQAKTALALCQYYQLHNKASLDVTTLMPNYVRNRVTD